MDADDEEPWPQFRSYSRPGVMGPSPGGRAAREAQHEQRLGEHVQRHRARGGQPRGRDRALSRDEIVRAAIAIADAEGPDAISMRRIARELRAGVMSLYWHVGSKEELLDLMLDSLQAEIGMPEPTGDWMADLRELARRQREGLLRHQWVMGFIGGRPPSGPNDAQNLERMLGILSGLDLSPRMVIDILMTVGTYVTGAVLREVQEIRGDRSHEQMEATMTKEELEAEQERFHAWLSATDRFPNIRRMAEADIDPDAAETREERFEFGLGCLLDGISTRLPEAGPNG